MPRILTIAVVAALLGTGAYAKAHDQGVADGQPTPDNTGDFVKSADGPGISAGVKNGQRGEEASAEKGENRTVPAVND